MNETVRAHGKRAICFDVNQTLVQQELSFETCFRSVWETYAGRWVHDDDVRAEQLWEQYMTRWQQRRKGKTGFRQLDELQQQCLRDAFHALDLPVSGSMAESFIQEVRWMQTSAKTVSPQAYETLELLSKAYRLAIISNSSQTEVLHMLGRFGLDSFFPAEHVFTTQRHGDKKPSPHLFQAAMHTLQVAPRQVIMVGNSWKHDVCGAVKAGMDAVWLQQSSSAATDKKISRQRLGRRYVYLIKRLDQLRELLP
ncbi:HAD family hydrolase [Paenibacillus allorhizosphaerae]|uniref:Phosphoglycolate phosphatase n=1 Tax=Paenibacillus allorhizosphaerae TaxID=2849866 RepID=A0ABM8VS08_9BACL|nr:HAD family hydrolase [Paenibacillus allorhizosphaerae]CAG7655958.1 Phosphoglycolate phosphatase [Paenibacillus allorhizosphaerae]